MAGICSGLAAGPAPGQEADPETPPAPASRRNIGQPAWTHELGLQVSLDELPGLEEKIRGAGVAGRGLMVLSALDLEDAFAQDPELRSLEEALGPLRGAGVRTALTLHFSGRELPGPMEPERMAAWEMALGAVARLGAETVGAVILELPESLEASGRTIDQVAYLVKRTSVAVRTARRDLAVLIDLPEPPGDWLKPLLGEDVGPHIDGVALQAPPGADAGWVERQAGEIFRLRPGLRLLTSGWEADPPERALEIYLRAVGAGAGAVLFRQPAPEQEALLWTLLGRLRAQIPDRFPPADPAPLRFVDADGREIRVRHGRFFDPQRFEAVVWYQAEPGTAPGTAGVTLATADAASPSVFDLATNERRRLAVWQTDRKARLTRFNLTPRELPVLLRYHHEVERVGQRSDLKVDTERIPPVEEILARHQEFQAAQDRRLRRWIADATIALHYRIGTAGGNFDLTYHSVLYADPDGATEWEHRRLDFNGAPYRSQKLPDLPYVLPERVVQVPLRLTLDKEYRYRLAGSDPVDGAACWVVEFEPLDPSRNLYRGKVWIDKENHARRRLSARQTKVETPVLSVEDDLRFEPIEEPGGPLWILRRSRGQQLISVSGVNLVLVREIEFGGYSVNPADFEERRAAALASPSVIVRESEAGYETLERQQDGTRVPRPSGMRKTWLVLGGVFYNEAVDAPVPLAGVNYFNFKTGGRDLHLEVFAAGAFNFVNLTDPNWLGSRWEVGADLTTRAFPLSDRFLDPASDGEEVEEFGVDDVSQALSINGARQLGPFFKFTGFYELGYARYSRSEEAQSEFVTPSDTFVHSIEIRMGFDRQGTSLRAFGRLSRRSDWDRWGFPSAQRAATFGGPLAADFGRGSLLEDFDPDSRDFVQYGISVSRLWTPSIFQTLRGDLSWMQGEDLDRFSKFRFSTLGDLRLRGFGGSGVRFDQGGIARATYTFKVGPFLRLDAALEHGRVRERDLGGDFLSFTGAGLAGNFTLPRGWVARLDYGIGLASDLPEQKGEQEVVLVLLKIL